MRKTIVTITILMLGYVVWSVPLVVADTKQRIIKVAHQWEQEQYASKTAEDIGYSVKDYAALREALVLPSKP